MKGIKGLLSKLSDQDWGFRKNIIRNLINYPERDFIPFIEEGVRNHGDADLRNASMEVFTAMGQRAIPSLTRLLKDEDEEVRLFSANMLGDIKESSTVPALLEALSDSNVNVRVASAEALGEIGDQAAVPGLSLMLDDEPWVAMAAIKSIGDIGGQHALDVLHKCLRSDEYLEMALMAVERAGNEGSIESITPHIEGGGLPELALKALVKISEREGINFSPHFFSKMVPLLIEYQNSPGHDLKKASLMALIWSEDFRGLPCFIKALKDKDLQEYAINGIVRTGRKAVPAIVDALKDESQPQRRVLAKALSLLDEHVALVQFSGDRDASVRAEVALALGRLDTPKAAQTLSELLKDPDGKVRYAAKKAVESLK